MAHVINGGNRFVLAFTPEPDAFMQRTVTIFEHGNRSTRPIKNSIQFSGDAGAVDLLGNAQAYTLAVFKANRSLFCRYRIHGHSQYN